MNSGNLKISSAVMTHPDRIDAARRICDGHPELEAALIIDPDPDGPPSPIRTAQIAWRAVSSDSTHHLVIQDDAALCSNFLEQVYEAVSARPMDALGFYTEWGSRSSYAVRLAALVGHSWAHAVGDYMPALAIVLPSPIAIGVSEYMRSQCDLSTPDDVAIARYINLIGGQALISIPNLADYVGLPSLIGNDFMGRRPSVCYVKEPGSVDWTTPTVRFPLVPYQPRARYNTRAECCILRSGAAFDWERVPAVNALRDYGLDEQRLEASLAAVLSVAGNELLSLTIDNRLLGDLWHIACAIGVALAWARGDSGTASLSAALARPLAERALRAMPGGALRDHVGRTELDQMTDRLNSLVGLGIEEGYYAYPFLPGRSRK